MAAPGVSAPLVGGVGLLERALAYTLGSLVLVTDDALPNPTPCAEWNLQALLQHMDDSLTALDEAGGSGFVPLAQQYGGRADDLVRRLRDRGCAMLGSWAGNQQGTVRIDDRALTTSVLTAAGALEVTIHGWDVAQACGRPRPIPRPLAEELLDLAPLLVTEADRPARFARPRSTGADADAAARLLAFLGRRPAGERHVDDRSAAH